MYRQIKLIVNIILVVCIVSASVLFLSGMCAVSAKASSSNVHFSTTGGISSAGDGPQQIAIVRDGDTTNETAKVFVQIMNASLTDGEYQYGPTVFSWDAGDHSNRNLTVTVPATIKDDVRQTITFGLIKVEGNGDVSEPMIYEMVIDFPINDPVATPTQDPTVTISATPTAIVSTIATAVMNGSPSIPQNGVHNNSTTNSSADMNNTTAVVSNAQDMPIVMFGGLVSLAVLITAGYLLLFKRK